VLDDEMPENLRPHWSLSSHSWRTARASEKSDDEAPDDADEY
jgi:hypothetical protein